MLVQAGYAYEVSVELGGNSSIRSRGELVVLRNKEIIARKSNLKIGHNTFIFYAEHSEKICVDLKGSNLHCLSEFDVSSVGEIAKDSKSLLDLDVVAAVASIPSRVESLRDSVASILPQVERLFVYLNGYSSIPLFLDHDKIEVVLDKEGRNAAAAKLYWLSVVKAYYFSIDDDIIYPSDYCEKTIKSYESQAKGAVVSYHGKNFKVFAAHARTDRKSIYLFEDLLTSNRRAHVLGTGVMMVDTRRIDLPLFSVAAKHPKAIDLAVSIFLRKHGVKRIVLAKENGWLKQNNKVRHGLNEFKQLMQYHANQSNKQVADARPWVESLLLKRLIELAVIPLKPIMSAIDKNKKLKKLLRDPIQFFMDSKNPVIRKLIHIK